MDHEKLIHKTVSSPPQEILDGKFLILDIYGIIKNGSRIMNYTKLSWIELDLQETCTAQIYLIFVKYRKNI